MGKYNFTERWNSTPFGEMDHRKGGNDSNAWKRIKPLTAIWIPINLFMKLKQFKRTA